MNRAPKVVVTTQFEPGLAGSGTLSHAPLVLPPAARSSGKMILVRQHSRGAPHLPVLAAEHDSENMIPRTTSLPSLRGPAAQPTQRAGCRGGRNARATGLRSRAFPISPGNSPSRIASCRRLRRNHPSASLCRDIGYALAASSCEGANNVE
jgi:hypothetical protein